MTHWIKNRLTRLLHPTTSTSREASSTRFRPSMIALEDRTVPSGADLFANATVINGAFYSDVSDNTGAMGETQQIGSTLYDEADFNHANGEINSLWWQWTAPSSGVYEINTFNSGIDTVLAVYSGTDFSNLFEEAFNDDDLIGNDGVLQSRVRFTATADVTYHIAIDGFLSDTGVIALNLGGVPANDNFANATVVTGGSVSGSNVQATYQAGEPTIGISDNGSDGDSTDDGNTVWWSWTPSTSAQATITTAGSTLDTILAVYTGTALNDLQLVAFNDDVNFPTDLTSSVTFAANAGTTYYIAVDGYLHHTGEIVLNIPNSATNNPPVVNDQSFSVNENSGNGTVVGSVVANDPDAGDTLTYSITGGNTGGAFAINSSTGQITVANSAALNFEATPSFSLSVMVADDGSPVGSDSATVTISLNDVNENPVFTSAGPFSLAENSANGTSVGSVSATDEDAGQTATLSFSITGGNTNGAFAINTATGEITVANSVALDFETTPTFTLSVTVTDSGALSTTTSVSISLTDVNEVTPTQQFANLNNMVIALRNSGDLNNMQANKLLKDLDAAQKAYNKGNIAQAESNLQLFINKVQGYINTNVLTSAEGQPLIDAAQDLINSI
jgi:cadherin domain-containing protein/FIMAH domain-containing protein